MSPILILLAPQTVGDPPPIDLPTPLGIGANATFLALKGDVTALDIDTHITTMGVDGNVREMVLDGD